MRNCALVLSAALFVTSLASAAVACPDLSGTFDCPASGGQPAMTLVVTTKPTVDAGAAYTFTYNIMGKSISSDAEASPKGLPSKYGQINACSQTAFLRKSASGAVIEQIFINAAGDYETDKGGKTQMTCVRKGK